MRSLIALATIMTLTTSVFSQLDDGTIAPDFTLDDINSVTHTLYDYLDDGKGVLIDFSATWCGICWNYHSTGTMENVWNSYGSPGTDEVMVFFIEPDPVTSVDCIYGNTGCSGGSIGNWTTGVTHPIFSPDAPEASAILNDYDIGSFPTIYAIGPNYKAYEVGRLDEDEWGEWVESFTLEADYTLVTGDGCSLIDVEIDASGGFGSLQYDWSNGETGSILEAAQPGTYTVEVSDDNGYSVEVGPIIVTPGGGISIALDDIEDESCYEENDGYIEVAGQNGSGDFSYDWNNGADTAINDNLAPGDYTVLITDIASGCTAEETYTIFGADFFGAEVNAIPTNCEGQNGILEIDVDGGNGNLIYFANGVPYNEPIIEDLVPGSYSIVVRDATNCTVNLSAMIEQPLTPDVDTLMPDIITCSQQMISLSADSSSLGEHIIYTWNLDTLAIDTGYVVQTDTFGLFTLKVIDTISTCLDSLSFTVATDTILPSLLLSTDANTLTCDITSTQLNGSTDIDSLEFSWTNDTDEIISTDGSVEVSDAGNYTLQLLDLSNGCISLDSIEVLENLESPTIVLDQISDLDCQNTTTTVSIIDDQQATYQWTTENGSISGDATGPMIIVESAGQYTVVGTSIITGCMSEESYTVASSTDVPEVSISEPDLLTCDQESTLLQANDELGYSYEWLDDQGSVIGQGATYETDSPGAFTLRVTDNSNGCSKLTTVIVNQDIDMPQIALQSKGDLSCINQEATISVMEIENHSYQWSSNNGMITSGVASNEVIVSAAGQYQLLLTNDLTGCSSQESFDIVENIETPEVAIFGFELLTCDLEQINLIADQNEDYTYEWSNNGLTISDQSTLEVSASGTYQLITTDQENGCTFSQSIIIEENKEEPTIDILEVGSVDCSGANATIVIAENDDFDYEWTTQDGNIIGNFVSATLEVDQAGFYEVTATDKGNGCSSTQEVEVLFSQAPPEIEVSGDLMICQGGSTTLCMTTTNGDTQWFIDGNLIGSDECVEVNQAVSVEAVSTNLIGCTTSTQVSVVEYAFPEYNTTGGQQVLDCVTSVVDLAYVIDNANDISAVWTDSNGQVIGESTSIGITQPGLYTLTLVNVPLGCEESTAFEIVMDDTALPTFELATEGELTQVFSYVADDEVDSQVWSFGDGATSTEPNPTYTYVIPGIYEVCLTTQNKCGEHTDCTEIVAAIPINISDQATSILECFGDEEGSISLSLTDGLEPYSVEWTGPNGYTAEGLEITGLEAGDYQAEISDAGNTEEVLQFTISQPDEIEISAELIQDETIGQANGSISLIVLGGTGDLTFTWSHGPETASVSDLEAGDYSVVIEDENGCQLAAEFTVAGVVSSVSEIDGLNLFEANPNPTTGLLTINIEMADQKNVTLSLMDITGKIQRTIEITNEVETLQLDLSELTEGVYFMRLTEGNQVTSRRIMIVR